MKKIVYIIGAGASAGVLPTVTQIPDSLNAWVSVLDERLKNSPSSEIFDSTVTLTEAYERLINDLKWLRKKASAHASVDTYAKKLHLKQQREELKLLKSTLTGFFLLEQITKPVDLRYDTFFAATLDKDLKIPEHIKIISWNYDFQMEKAYSEFVDDKDVSSLEFRLGVRQKFSKSQGQNATIFKINGTTDYLSSDGSVVYKPMPYVDTYGKNDSWDDAVKAHYRFTHGTASNSSPRLSFAWEADEGRSGIINTLVNNIRDARILVVIGYSFPFFNRGIDRQILSSMGNLEGIYVQDRKPINIKERLKSALPDRINAEAVQLIEDTDQFFLPPEL